MELLDGEEGSLVQVRVRRGGQSTFDVCLERSLCRAKPPTRKACRAAEELPEQPRGTHSSAITFAVHFYVELFAAEAVAASDAWIRLNTSAGAVERIYAGMAKLNQSLERAPEQDKFTAEELKVFRAAMDEEARQLQARAQREFDTTRRRNAEIQVLKCAA
eukprot:721023-Rhodomonas_salina.2